MLLRHANSFQREKPFSLAYQCLEARNLLASFVGTENADIVVVTFETGSPRYVEINGVTFDNFDATAELDLLGGHDELTLLGDAFDVELMADDFYSSDPGSGIALPGEDLPRLRS